MKIYHHDLSEAKHGLSVTTYKSQKDFEDYLKHTDAITSTNKAINNAGQVFGTIFTDALELEDPLAFAVGQGFNAILKIGTEIEGAILKYREHNKHIMAKDNLKPTEFLEWNWTEIKDKYDYGRWQFPGNFVVVTKGDKHNFVYCGYINPGGLMGITEQNGKVYGGTDLYFNAVNNDDAYKNGGHSINTGLTIVGVVAEGLRRYQVNLGLEPYHKTHKEYGGDSPGVRMYEERDGHNAEKKDFKDADDKVKSLERYMESCAGHIFDASKNQNGELLQATDDKTIDELKSYLAKNNLQNLFDENEYNRLCYPIKK